jgi:23S rRNA (adenine2503-C2)-methyltransferase
MNNEKTIFDLSIEEIKIYLQEIGEPNYRAFQLWDGLYRNLYQSWDDFTIFSKKLRGRISEDFSLKRLRPLNRSFSKDKKTQKILFELADKNRIETVLMRYGKRNTVCISCQSGCAMGCVFCATGKMGLHRNLSNGEIIEQVIYFARELKQKGEQLTKLVIMGMGEPFLNYTATMSAISCLNDPAGFNFGCRRITISSIGITSQLEIFMNENHQVNLAISLHAPNDRLRNRLVPINKKYPIKKLISACKRYTETTHRRISFEYVLIEGLNDSKKLASELSDLIKDILCHVNLIPLNPTPLFKGRAPKYHVIRDFKDVLENQGIATTIRESRGTDIQAGCGQLVNSYKNP